MFLSHTVGSQIGFKKNLLLKVEKWIKVFNKMKKRVSFQMDFSHCLTLMDSLIDEGSTFNLIETSNLADHMGMLNLLIGASNLLKNSNSIIKTSSFFVYADHSSLKEYLEYYIGIPMDTYPTFLGLDFQQ
jgi:hypothetical protein